MIYDELEENTELEAQIDKIAAEDTQDESEETPVEPGAGEEEYE